MRKHLLLILMLTALFPWSLRAQTLTVNEGTATNEYVPIYGFYCDALQENQFILPSSLLTEMADNLITGMTFYAQTSSASWGCNWNVKLMETTASTVASLASVSSATLVYSGDLSVSSSTLAITFDSPFSYSGGNLLVDFSNTNEGAYIRCYFLGTSAAENSSLCTYEGYEGWSGTTTSPQPFLPKVTFTYEAPASCPKPMSVAATNVTANTAAISWTAGGSEASWEVVYGVAGFTPDWTAAISSATTTYNVAGLNPNTSYDFYVRAVCGAGDFSGGVKVTFRTECDATIITEANPYIENFDAETFPPDCWSQTQLALTNTWSRTTTTKHGSTGGAAYIPDKTAGTETALVTNAIAFDGSTDYQVIFWMYRASNNYQSKVDEAIHVYVGPDADNVTNATEIGVINEHYLNAPAEAAPDWYEYTCNVPANTAGNKYVLFVYHNQYGAGAYIDDITIRETPSCVKPSGLAVSNITNESAELAWTERGTATAWQVAYSTDGETWTTENAGTNPFTLTGLTSNTHYYVKIRSYCSAEDQSEYTAVTDFYTACEVLTITKASPFVENFDSFTGSSSSSANNLPNCWNYVNTSTNSSYYNYPIVYNSSSYSAHNCIQFCHYYSYSSALSEDQYLVLPEVRNDASTLMLQLYAKTSGTTTAYVRSFTVGVMDDPTDASTFTAVETVSNLTTNYAQYESYLNGYEGSGKYVAIKVAKPVSGSYTYSYVYVDDIKLKLIPRCFPVASVSFADVERTSMTINWTKNSNPAAVNTDYQVVLSTTQLDADGLAAATPVEVLNATTYTATNLERNTLYYVYVRSACGGDDYSEWVEATQRTLGLMVCDNTIGDGTIGAGGVPVYSSYGNTYSQQIFTAEELTAAGIVAGNITGISYDWNGGGSYQKMLSIYIGSTSKSSFSSASDWVPGSALQLGYGPAVHESTTSGKVDYPFSTPFNWDGTSNIVIATIVNQHNGSTGSSGFTAKGTTATDMAIYKYKDSYPYSYDPSETTDYTGNSKAGYRANISFCQDMPACPEITGLQVVNNGVDEVEFGWTASTGDYVGEYEVFNYKAEAPDYGPLADVDGYYETLQHDDVQVVTGTSVTVSHLDENTVYYLYVRALCNANAHDDGMSGWVSIQYRTLADCLTPVDLVATVNGKKDVTVTWTNGSYDATEERSEQESNFYWILATDDITEGGNLEIEINHPAQVAQNFEGELEGAITDDHAQITFSEAEINLLDHNQTYYFYVRNDCDGSGAWVSTTFTTPDECPAVVNLAVSNQTAHTALLTWDKGEYGDETEWKVAWGSNEFYTTEQSFLVYGLAAETTTTVSVYAACDKNHGVFGTAATVEVTTTAEGGNFVQVGNETTVSTYSIPVSNYYKYSYSQQIFDASELKAGTIEAISYQYKHSSAMTKATDVTIYMGHTTKTVFESTADWISISQLTQVYNGALNCSQGWNDFTLDTPFEYNGQDNLIVAVHDNTTSYDGSAYTFYSSYCTGNKTLYYQNDYAACPADAPVAGTQAVFRNNTRFIFVPEDCPRIAVITTDTLTTEMAGLSWMPAGGEMTWNYVVSTSATLDADALDAHTDASVIAHAEDYAQRFVELNGLTPDGHYFLYVQSICGTELVSVWSAPYEFVTVATCVAPTALLVNNITNESAELAWTERGTATAWDVIYSSDNGANWSTPVSALTNPYTLTGLSGNTDYQVMVRAHCSDDDQSEYTQTVAFTTECDALVIGTSGYTEDFESYDAVSSYYTQGTMPDCWSSIFTGTSTSYNVKTSSYGSYALGSGNYILITVGTYSSYGTANYAILPSISNDYDNLKISFDYKMRSSTGSTVSFGYLTDPADATTFTAIGSALTNSTSNVSKEITLDGYNVPSGACLAFKAYATTSYSFYFSFDNLNIIDTTIVVYAPTALSVSDIGYSGATVSWTAGSTEEKWQYVYGESGFTPDWTNPSEVTATTCTLTGLNSSTDYDVYVRSWYDAETISEPVMISFTTKCDPISTFPYVEKFDGLTTNGQIPDCWDNDEGTTTDDTYKWSYDSSYGTGVTGTCVRFDSYNNDEGMTNFLKSPVLALPDEQIMMLSFQWKNPRGGDFSVYISTDGGQTYETALATGLTAQSSWKSEEISLAAYAGQNVVIVFKGTSNWEYGDARIYLDDVTVAPSCIKPSGLEVSNITSAGATLSWTSSASNFVVAYGTGTDPDQMTKVNAETNSIALTGLNANTEYNAYVKAVCSETDESDWSIMATFLTDVCAAIDLTTLGVIGFETSEGFVTGPNPSSPNCWTFGNMQTNNPSFIPYICNSTLYAYGGSNNCLFLPARNTIVADSAYAVMPEFSATNLNQYMLRFYARQGNTAWAKNLVVGVMTDPMDMSTFVQVGSANVEGITYAPYEVSLASYSGNGRYIAFLVAVDQESNGNAVFCVDNLEVILRGVFNTDGNIATAANWSGAEVPTTTGYIAAEATVSADFTIADLNILEGGKVTVTNGATLTVTGTLTNSDAANIVIEDGGQLVNASATKATIQKEIDAYTHESGTDADGWYLIAAPITDAAASMVTTGTYDFYTHDEAAYVWRNYKVQANQTAYSWLTNGYGYLYANAADQTLNFAGTVAADGEKEIELDYTSTGTNTGWNLLGNHTAHNVTIESDFELLSVKVMDINGIDYTDKLVSTDTFAPCEGFFVQATEAGQHVTINPTSTAKSQEAPQGFIRLNLVDNNTPVFTDVAYITMEGGIGSENITFSEVAPQLYVPIDGVDYSVAVVDAEQTIIPVSFKATANSMYTISLNLINAHFETVILRDLKTGINTDLKNGDYVFSGNIDDAENRFNLILAVEAPEGIEEDNAPFAYQSGSDIIFTDTYGTVQVMDVLGRVMSETRIDGDARISTRGFVSGTYVLRLLGSESVRTQKIVVK